MSLTSPNTAEIYRFKGTAIKIVDVPTDVTLCLGRDWPGTMKLVIKDEPSEYARRPTWTREKMCEAFWNPEKGVVLGLHGMVAIFDLVVI